MKRVWRRLWRKLPGPSRTLHRIAALNRVLKMFSLRDKVAVVTGASQGIGRDTALALAEAGAKVVAAARSEEKLSALVNEIAAAGGEAWALKMDVADADQVKTGFRQII